LCDAPRRRNQLCDAPRRGNQLCDAPRRGNQLCDAPRRGNQLCYTPRRRNHDAERRATKERRATNLASCADNIGGELRRVAAELK